MVSLGLSGLLSGTHWNIKLILKKAKFSLEAKMPLVEYVAIKELAFCPVCDGAFTFT